MKGTLKKMPQIQLYMVGSDGVLVPVETAVVLSTSHYSTQDAQAESFTPVLHSTWFWDNHNHVDISVIMEWNSPSRHCAVHMQYTCTVHTKFKHVWFVIKAAFSANFESKHGIDR